MENWKEQNNELLRSFTFPDFKETMAFTNLVAKEAERMGHHPDIYISYGRVEFRLTTHEKGGITDKDKKLAKNIDLLYNREYEK